MTIPEINASDVEFRPTPVPYDFHTAFMTDDELIDDAIAFANLTILANQSATDGLQYAMPLPARFEEARDFTWRIILTRRAQRRESPWPTLRDRLRGCRFSGRPSEEHSFTRWPMPPEESAYLGDAADALSGGGDR